MFEEWAGTQVHIRPDAQGAFRIKIFHVKLVWPLAAGERVGAGQQLGTHIGSRTMSDIAIEVNSAGGTKLLSYFDVITDSLFTTYRARGLDSRTDAIISKEARDADPLSCSGETFLSRGKLENWVVLN